MQQVVIVFTFANGCCVRMWKWWSLSKSLSKLSLISMSQMPSKCKAVSVAKPALKSQTWVQWAVFPAFMLIQNFAKDWNLWIVHIFCMAAKNRYRNPANRWQSPKESPDLCTVFLNEWSIFKSKSPFIGRSTVDLHNNGVLLISKMPLRGKTALTFGDYFFTVVH